MDQKDERDMTHWTTPLIGIACDDGIEEGQQYATLAAWWEGTQRSNYMLWLLKTIEYGDERTLRLLAVRFVRETRLPDGRTVWDLLTDERSRQAVIVAERYANGQARIEELRAAWEAAQDAAQEAAWYAARHAALAAAWEAAWYAARHAALAAAWDAAWAWTRSQQADIIREMIPAAEVQVLFDRYITQEEIA